MHTSLFPSLVAAFAAVLVASPSTVQADAAGDQVLAAMDAAMNRAKTHKFDYDVVNQEPAKAERSLAMRAVIKGEKRLIEFLGPADMKGTRVLILSPTQVYAYLPAFGKVRRIASHTSDQSFMGLAFSQDDLATQAFGGEYTATIAAEDAATWTLALTPKAGKETTYAKIEVVVGKDRSLPAALRYFNSEGKLAGTETRTGYTCEGNVCTAGEIKMVDNLQGNWTRLVRKTWKVNEEIADDVFSQRNLAR